MVRKHQVTMVQRRVTWIHCSPLARVASAAKAKANGTVKPTKPR